MSETVKRWTEQVSFDGLSHRMTEFEHGEYVSYCDYVVLEQRCAALERERDEAMAGWIACIKFLRELGYHEAARQLAAEQPKEKP